MRLGESPNEHEAALAIATAQALLERFEMELADLGADLTAAPEPLGEDEIETARPGARARKMEHWKLQLCSALARANGVSLFYARSKITLCGRRSDTARVRQLFQECAHEVERLAFRLARENGRSYAHSFRMGVVYAVRKAIDAERAALKAEMAGKVSSRALVVVDTRREEAASWMAHEHRNLRSAGYSSGPRSAGGYGAGLGAGAGVYGAASRGRLSSGARQLPSRGA